MQSGNRSDSRVPEALLLMLRRTPIRAGIVLGLAILYAVSFPFLTARAGSAAIALVAIPVALAGWFFGIRAGLIASLLGVLLSVSLLTLLQGGDLTTWIFQYWPGNLVVIVIGLIAGNLRDGLAERARIKTELHYHERFLALITLTTKNILNPKNPDEKYYYLVTHLANLFVADYAHLIRWDNDRDQGILQATTLPLDGEFTGQVLEPSDSAFAHSVLQAERARVVEDVAASPYAINPSVLGQPALPARSALGIPLIAGGYRFGAAIVAFSAPRRFSYEEIRYAEMAGNQIALALWTVQQELRIQTRLKEANALANIESVLSATERVGLGTVLQLIVNSARELIPGVERAVLHLLDEERQILVPRAVTGYGVDTKTNLNMKLGEGVAGRVISTGEVTFVPDTRGDPRFADQVTPVTFRSLIVAPIQTNEQRVGTISIQSSAPNVFTADESRLLAALGTQAAIAIENANLFETTQQQLKESHALYRISQGLVASLDPDKLMKEVVDLLQKEFDYHHVQIFVVDNETGDMVLRHASGRPGARLREQGHRLQVGAGIIGHTAETGEPFFTNDVNNVVFFVGNPLMPETQSEMTVPIKIENRVVGVLDIQQAPPDRLTRRHMQLMAAVTDQLAVALQQANLYAELQTSLGQEKAMRSQLIQSERLAAVGRLLASVSHELNNPLQAIQNALFLIKEEEKLSPQGRQDLEIVLSETERMTAMIDRLRATYRPTRTEDFQGIHLNSIVEDVCALTATHMRHKEITLQFLPDPELPPVSGIPEQIRQVVLNLLMNAVEAMSMGGRLTIQTERLPAEDRILLSIADSGPGIDPQILPHVFEPFVTSKETGTGLGLTISYDIIHQHNGDILAENNPNGGATFKVWLPLGEAART